MSISRQKNYQSLKSLLEKERVLFGVADVREIKGEFNISPPELLHELDRAISIAIPLNLKILEGCVDAPTLHYRHHYRQVNLLLDQLSLKIAGWIEERGFKSLPIPASLFIDWKSERAHLSHRKIASLAGLGWRGKNNLLVTPRFGSAVRLASILTNMPLKAGTPMDDGCGDCEGCIASCPAGAIGNTVDDFKREVCFNKVREFEKKGMGVRICGLCIRACMGQRL